MDAQQPEPVRVHLASSDVQISQQAPPPGRDRVVTRFLTETVDNTNPVRPLLPDDPHRVGAWLQATAAAASVNANGTQTSAAAGTVITSAAAPAGTYTVSWSVVLTGTLAANDEQNMGLYVGGTLVATAINGINAGTIEAQPPVTVVVPAGGAIIAVKAINLATVASVYQASFAATPAGAGVVLCASQPDAQQTPPQGSVLPSGNTAPWPVRGQGAVWAAQNTPGTSCVISVTADYDISAS
jgi:hypothetical protein